MMRLVLRQSPNQSSRNMKVVDTVVLHADASDSCKASVNWCCNPESKVSYHAIVDRDGTVYQLVDVNRRAWHAGTASFGGHTDVNSFSIGLSFSNDNKGEPYTEPQYTVGAALVAQWMKLFPAITMGRITTHAAIALPAGRKTDPKGFDLVRFRTMVAAELAKVE